MLLCLEMNPSTGAFVANLNKNGVWKGAKTICSW